MFFDFYRHNGQEFVGRSWLIAPEEVQRKAETLGPSKKRPNLGLEVSPGSPSGSRTALVSVYPKASGPEPGLIADIRVDDLAKQFGFAPDDLRAALPERLGPRQIPGLYLYAEGYSFRTSEDVDRFLAKLGGAASEIEGEVVPPE